MIKDFSSLDRIKQRRWSAVYLADMHHLKESEDVENRKVWQAFKNYHLAAKRQKFLEQQVVLTTTENKTTKR